MVPFSSSLTKHHVPKRVVGISLYTLLSALAGTINAASTAAIIIVVFIFVTPSFDFLNADNGSVGLLSSSQHTASPSMMQERERRRATASIKRPVRSLPGRL